MPPGEDESNPAVPMKGPPTESASAGISGEDGPVVSMNEPPSEVPLKAPPDGSSQQERNWTMGCHLSSLLAYTFIPLANVLGPLVVWLVKKDQIPALDAHGKEAVNFNISLAIYVLVCIPLTLVLIGIPLIVGLLALHLVVTIIAAVKASNGELFRYPLSIKFIR